MRDVREWAAPLVRFVNLHRDPVVVRSLRSAAAATVAYVIALRLSPEAAPLTAPLTALLVVQVTLYSTLTTGIRRVNSVVAGVLVAIAFSLLVGLTWWSLGLVIVAALAVGHLVRVDEFVNEVAISAMLVLGVTTVGNHRAPLAPATGGTGPYRPRAAGAHAAAHPAAGEPAGARAAAPRRRGVRTSFRLRPLSMGPLSGPSRARSWRTAVSRAMRGAVVAPDG